MADGLDAVSKRFLCSLRRNVVQGKSWLEISELKGAGLSGLRSSREQIVCEDKDSHWVLC